MADAGWSVRDGVVRFKESRRYHKIEDASWLDVV